MMKVSEFVIPHHRKWFNHILDHDIKNHIAGTGRGVGKSVCVQDGVACDMENQYALGNPVESVCIRQTQNTHASTTMKGFMRRVYNRGMGAYYRELTSKLCIEYHPYTTSYRYEGKPIIGGRLLFFGLDNANKLRGYSPSPGFTLSTIWLEECQEIENLDVVHNDLFQTFKRYVSPIPVNVIYTYNPPQNADAPINHFKTSKIGRPDTLIIEGTYLDVPRELMTDDFIEDAEEMKRENPKLYEHIYLGKTSPVSSRVFNHLLRPCTFTEDSIRYFMKQDNVLFGADFGVNDPTTLVGLWYDKKNGNAYVFYEWEQTDASMKNIAAQFKKVTGGRHIYGDNNPAVYCKDLSEEYDVNISKVYKENVINECTWIALTLNNIYIDPNLTPKLYDKLQTYSRAVDKKGKVLDVIAKGQEPHLVDGFRYAFNGFIYQ